MCEETEARTYSGSGRRAAQLNVLGVVVLVALALWLSTPHTSLATSAITGSPGNEMLGAIPTTIAQLRALTSPAPSNVFYITDKGQEGIFVHDPSDKSSRDNTGTTIVTRAGERFKRPLEDGLANVKWFGAKGDGSHDDTAAIQSALDSADAIYFPPGVYRTTNTLMLNSSKLLQGAGFTNDAKASSSSQIFFDNKISRKPAFFSTAPNHTISDLFFRAEAIGTVRKNWSRGFVFAKGTVYGDTDVRVINSVFHRFSTSIELEGRGLWIRDSTFVEQWDPIVIKHFNNNEDRNPPVYDWQTNIRGFRKFHFINNEFHSVQGHAFVVEDTGAGNERHIHQVVVIGNRHDGTGGFWRGYLGGGVVSGNTIGKAHGVLGSVDMYTFDLTGAHDVAITGNVFASEFDMSNVLGREIYLNDVFHFRSGGEFQNINISSNTLVGVGGKVVNSHSPVKGLNVAGNSISGVLLTERNPNSPAFRFGAGVEDSLIRDNIIFNTSGVAHDVLVSFEKDAVRAVVSGNIISPNEFRSEHDL